MFNFALYRGSQAERIDIQWTGALLYININIVGFAFSIYNIYGFE